MRCGFVEAGICEAVDEAQGDCDLEGDPFADIDEQWYNYTSLVYGTTYNCQMNHINLVSVCGSPHYLNKH